MFKCPNCGFEAQAAGNCPKCNVPLQTQPTTPTEGEPKPTEGEGQPAQPAS